MKGPSDSLQVPNLPAAGPAFSFITSEKQWNQEPNSSPGCLRPQAIFLPSLNLQQLEKGNPTSTLFLSDYLLFAPADHHFDFQASAIYFPDSELPCFSELLRHPEDSTRSPFFFFASLLFHI